MGPLWHYGGHINYMVCKLNTYKIIKTLEETKSLLIGLLMVLIAYRVISVADKDTEFVKLGMWVLKICSCMPISTTIGFEMDA